MKTPSSRRVHRRPDVSIAVQKFLRILLTNPTLDRPALRSSLRAWPPGRAQTHCEHVRDATADLVEVILAASATVKVLATSREGLGVADEQLWLVSSFDVGAGIAWAEELLESARVADHPRLAALYLMASNCWTVGRIADAVGYSHAGQSVMGSGCDEVPFGGAGLPSVAHLAADQPERTVQWCRAELDRGRDTPTLTRAALVLALVTAGNAEEAMAAATDGLIDAAEATGNPCVLSYALYVYGFAFRDAAPDRSLDARRRALSIAQDSGNRHGRLVRGRWSIEDGGQVRRSDGCPRLRHRGRPRLPRLGQRRADQNTIGGGDRPLRSARTPRTRRHHRRFRI